MRLVKLPDNGWVNPEKVVRISQGSGRIDADWITIHLIDEDSVTIKGGYTIDQVASIIMETQFAVIDDDLVVNKSQVESVSPILADMPDGTSANKVKLRMASGQVWVTDSDIEDVLDQLDGIPFFREEESRE